MLFPISDSNRQDLNLYLRTQDHKRHSSCQIHWSSIAGSSEMIHTVLFLLRSQALRRLAPYRRQSRSRRRTYSVTLMPTFLISGRRVITGYTSDALIVTI